MNEHEKWKEMVGSDYGTVYGNAVHDCICLTERSTDRGQHDGVGGVELESGKPENFKNVILPTISSETYSFMIDPFGALNKYDPDTYSTAKTA